MISRARVSRFRKKPALRREKLKLGKQRSKYGGALRRLKEKRRWQ